jgi:hypothetical protein
LEQKAPCSVLAVHSQAVAREEFAV